MGFKIPCPNCGRRNLYEFTYGSEVRKRPGPDANLKVWRHYLYYRQNAQGPQEEWWHHSAGCGTWFKVRRDTSTNKILED